MTRGFFLPTSSLIIWMMELIFLSYLFTLWGFCDHEKRFCVDQFIFDDHNVFSRIAFSMIAQFNIDLMLVAITSSCLRRMNITMSSRGLFSDLLFEITDMHTLLVKYSSCRKSPAGPSIICLSILTQINTLKIHNFKTARFIWISNQETSVEMFTFKCWYFTKTLQYS